MSRATWLLAACALSTLAVAGAAFVAWVPRESAAGAMPSLAAAAPQDVAPPFELSALPVERRAVPRSNGARERGAAEPVAPVRATVVLTGALANARGLGRELDLRVQPWWKGGLERAPRAELLPVQWAAFDDHWTSADLDALDPLDVERVRETMVADGEPGLSLVADAHGDFVRDVTALLSGTRGVPDGLVLTLQHENFRALSQWIPLQSGGAPVDAERLALDGRLDLFVRATLTPMCLLKGVARCFDGDCAVRVEAWTLDSERPGRLAAEVQLDPGRDEYTLAVEPARRYAVVALADGYLPRTLIAYTWDELDLRLAPFVLDHGARFAGRIDLARHTFGGEVWVYVSREKPVLSREPRYGRDGLVWTGREFAPEMGGVATRDGGAFAFEGLTPGNYELRIGIDRQWWTEMDPIVYVSAPAEGVLIPAPLARISIELEQERQPLIERVIRLQGLGRSSGKAAELTTDHGGRAEAWLLRGEPYLIHVPMPSGPEWSYGRVVPWERSDVRERITMAPWRGRR